jgi:hypothetical protein
MATAAFGLVMAALRLTIRVLRLTIAALGSLAGSLRRLQPLASTVFGRLRRAAAYAAVLGIVLAAGWLARPYWPMVVARLTAPLSQQPEAPPEQPVAPGPATAGQLIARSEPPGARVTIDGEPRGVTPLTVDGLSLGRHTVVIATDQGSVRRTVTVTADRPALVSESIFAGFLKVFAPFELRITDGRRAIQLDDQNQALLPPGSYALQLENASLGYRDTRRVEVNPGQTTTLSIVPPPSALTVTASAPAVVLVDGEQVGETPLTNHPIALGTRDIVVRSIAGPERRYTRRVTVAPIQIEVDFSRP